MLKPHIKDRVPYDGKPNIGDKLVYQEWSYNVCAYNYYTVVAYSQYEVVLRSQSEIQYTYNHSIFIDKGWYYWNRGERSKTGFGKFISRIEA